MAGTGGHFEQFGGVFGQHILDNEHVEEGAETGDDAALGGDCNIGLVELEQQLAEVVGGDIGRLETEGFGKTAQVRHIAQVGLDRVVGQVALKTQVGFEIANVAWPVHGR